MRRGWQSWSCLALEESGWRRQPWAWPWPTVRRQEAGATPPRSFLAWPLPQVSLISAAAALQRGRSPGCTGSPLLGSDSGTCTSESGSFSPWPEKAGAAEPSGDWLSSLDGRVLQLPRGAESPHAPALVLPAGSRPSLGPGVPGTEDSLPCMHPYL